MVIPELHMSFNIQHVTMVTSNMEENIRFREVISLYLLSTLECPGLVP